MEKWRERFIQRYRELKRRDGLTQEVLADRVGVTQGTIANWMNGRRTPDTIDLYERLAAGLNVHPAWLLYGININHCVEDMETLSHLKRWKELSIEKRRALDLLINDTESNTLITAEETVTGF